MRMNALKCITLDRAISTMTDDTVVRIYRGPIWYRRLYCGQDIKRPYYTGYLEFITLVVHNTQGMVVPCFAAYMLLP